MSHGMSKLPAHCSLSHACMSSEFYPTFSLQRYVLNLTRQSGEHSFFLHWTMWSIYFLHLLSATIIKAVHACLHMWAGIRSGGDLAPSLGGTEKISRTKVFEWRFLRKTNFHFRAQHFWWPIFSRRPGFSNFPFPFPDFPCLNYVKCRIWPFPHKKNTFFYSVRTFARIRHHVSHNIGGTDAWAVPHLKFLGDRPPSTPKSSPLGIRM